MRNEDSHRRRILRIGWSLICYYCVIFVVGWIDGFKLDSVFCDGLPFVVVSDVAVVTKRMVRSRTVPRKFATKELGRTGTAAVAITTKLAFTTNKMNGYAREVAFQTIHGHQRYSHVKISKALLQGLQGRPDAFFLNSQRKRHLNMLYDDDFDNLESINTFRGSSGKEDDTSDRMMLAKLRERLKQMEESEQNHIQRIRSANCTIRVGVILPDWVRRLDVSYSTNNDSRIVVCGSASDTIFVANLDSGELLASSAKYNAIHSNQNTDSTTDDSVDEACLNVATMRLLYGQYDGGGTVSVAMYGNIIVEGRRTGGVRVWRYNADSTDLLYQGTIPTLDNCIATSMAFGKHLQDDDYENVLLWIATDNGRVVVYRIRDEHQEDASGTESILLLPPLVSQATPNYEWNLQSTVVSVAPSSFSVPSGCAVAATASGFIHLLVLPNERTKTMFATVPSHRQFTPPFDSGTERRSKRVHPTCATIVRYSIHNTNDNHDESDCNDSSTKFNTPYLYSIVCGCSDGSMYIQHLNIKQHNNNRGTSILHGIDTDRPFEGQTIRSLMPSHFGTVKCVTAIPNTNGLFLTSGVDGSLRVWDILPSWSYSNNNNNNNNNNRNNNQTIRSTKKMHLYQFLGYKVWTGSLWTDGTQIVSDGADNTIIVHDFSVPTTITGT